MSKTRGVIEFRLDKRQAFYGFVGCMLIVSVAFVVGVIVGQRMQIPNLGTPLAVNEGPIDDPLVPVGLVDEEAEPEPDDFTFYDELPSGHARPQVMLTPPQAQNQEAPAVRALEREPVVEEPERVARVEAEPAPVPVEPEPPQAEEPAVEQLSDRGEEPADSGTRRVERRTVRRTNSASAEEFGFFIVEIGRYGSFDEADAIRIQLQESGHNAIVTLLSDGPRPFRVQMGNYTRRSEADSVASQLEGRVIQEG